MSGLSPGIIAATGPDNSKLGKVDEALEDGSQVSLIIVQLMSVTIRGRPRSVVNDVR